MNLKMDQFTTGNGKMDKDAEEVGKSGLMGLCTKAIGPTEWRTGMGGSFILMEIFMKDNGRMIRPMDLEFILTWKGPNTLDNGSKINKMDMEKRFGQMVQSIRVST